MLNTLPLVLLGLLLFALLDRAWLAFFLNTAVCLVFSWAQYWKLLARGDPIYAEDLLIFTEAVQMAGQYIQITWQITCAQYDLARTQAASILNDKKAPLLSQGGFWSG